MLQVRTVVVDIVRLSQTPRLSKLTSESHVKGQAWFLSLLYHYPLGGTSFKTLFIFRCSFVNCCELENSVIFCFRLSLCVNCMNPPTFMWFTFETFDPKKCSLSASHWGV